MKILSTLDLPAEQRQQLAEDFPDVTVRHLPSPERLSAEELADYRAFFTYGADLTAELLARMTALEWVHIGQSGVEKLPRAALQERAIRVSSSRGINAVLIAEYVLGMIINLARNNQIFYRAQQRHDWDVLTQQEEIFGKTLCVIGLGAAGRETALRAHAWGMHVLAFDVIAMEKPPFVDELYLMDELDRCLPRADYVAILAPLTPATQGLFDATRLALMKNTAALILASRGGIVREADLLCALEQGVIKGAAVDVFTKEPLPPDHPFWEAKNLWLTPHVAGDHFPEYMPRLYHMIRHNLSVFLKHTGSMKNLLDLGRAF